MGPQMGKSRISGQSVVKTNGVPEQDMADVVAN
jgi:hypothetical protein